MHIAAAINCASVQLAIDIRANKPQPTWTRMVHYNQLSGKARDKPEVVRKSGLRDHVLPKPPRPAFVLQQLSLAGGSYARTSNRHRANDLTSLTREFARNSRLPLTPSRHAVRSLDRLRARAESHSSGCRCLRREGSHSFAGTRRSRGDVRRPT
jgi:hypothetical protein